jgi:hypothetical protein
MGRSAQAAPLEWSITLTEMHVMSAEEVIRIMCPNLSCKRILAVPTTARGKLVRCRGCGINLRIPVGKVAGEPAAANAEGSAKPAAAGKSAAGKPAAAPSAATGKAA